MRSSCLRRILREERAQLRELFRRMDERPSATDAEKRALFYEIRVRIEDHLRGMDLLIQDPDVQAAAGPVRIAESRAGHRLLDSMLSELSAQDLRAPEYPAALRLLRRSVELLFDEVEEPLLGEAERLLPDAAAGPLALKLRDPARASGPSRSPLLRPEPMVPARTHRRVRRLAIALAIVVFLPAAAIVAVVLGVNPFVRSQVESLASSALKVPVALDQARVNIAGGIHLTRLSIGNPRQFKEVRSFRVKRIDVAVSLPSVFQDAVEVQDVLIVNPVLTIEIEKGAVNWSTMMDHLAAPAKEPVEEVKQKQKQFIVRRLRVVQPMVVIRSPKLAKGGAAITLRDIELQEIGTAPGSAAPFSLVLATVFQALLTGAIDEWTSVPGELGTSIEAMNTRTSEAYGNRLKTPQQ